MAMRLHNGDYVSDEAGGFRTVNGMDAVMQRVLMKLKARRGAFPLMPEFGSRLYRLNGVKPAARQREAEQYVSEALEGEEVVPEKVTVSETGGILSVDVTLRSPQGGFTVSLDV